MNQDIPEANIFSGSACYEFVYMDTICVTQGENSVEFEVKINKNRLLLFFMGKECLVLEKQ
ncbi:MAG: hypothetical protein NC432_02750 [Roseburia sp.]|nr:hypothetical protein [Roseburia sp.]MCM1097119.1 hypothetical protein [Ruminococcus flavefaciens]